MKRPHEEVDSVIGQTEPISKPISEDEKKLSEMIRFKKKLGMKKAKLIMSLDDMKSFDKMDTDHEKKHWCLPEFFVQDIQRVILFSTVGTQYRFFPRWCKILRPGNLKTVYMITVNNLSEYDYKKHRKLFKKFNKIFENPKNELDSIEFVSSSANGRSFFDEFVSVPISRSQWLKIRDEKEFQTKRSQVVDQYRKFFENSQKRTANNKSGQPLPVQSSDLDKIPRTSLLLNVTQMVREDYPLPFDKSNTHDTSQYVPTKDEMKGYAPVTDKSPLFSIDCEMCYNQDGDMEVVWLSMVNENLECVYETFVKPKRKIFNYLTQITGVSAKTLENVEVTLEDVQKKIQEILPADGILCGQSLNNDLHALKMFHPYVIDTSIIYNISGSRDIKPSLKRLAAQFLGKLIQESTHNPTIDAKASLQLVLLKLRQGLDFGDVIMNGCTNIYDENQIIEQRAFEMCSDDGVDLSDPRSISRFIYSTGINIDQDFFNVLRDHRVPNMFIDNKKRNLSKSCDQSSVNDNEEAKKVMLESLKKDNKYLWSQFYVESEKNAENQIDLGELSSLLKFIRKVHTEMSDESLLIVTFTGRMTENKEFLSPNQFGEDNELNYNDFFKGRCFLTHKNEEFKKLDEDIKLLYNQVHPDRIKSEVLTNNDSE